MTNGDQQLLITANYQIRRHKSTQRWAQHLPLKEMHSKGGPPNNIIFEPFCFQEYWGYVYPAVSSLLLRGHVAEFAPALWDLQVSVVNWQSFTLCLFISVYSSVCLSVLCISVCVSLCLSVFGNDNMMYLFLLYNVIMFLLLIVQTLNKIILLPIKRLMIIIASLNCC